MFKMLKSVCEFVSNKWSQFKQFVSNMIKGKPAEATEEVASETLNADVLKEMAYVDEIIEEVVETAKENNEKLNELTESYENMVKEVEEIKQVVEAKKEEAIEAEQDKASEELDQIIEDLQSDKEVEEESKSLTDSIVDDIVEDIKDAEKMEEKCKEQTVEEIESNIQSLLNDEKEGQRVRKMFTSKTKAKGFAQNYANSIKKLDGRVLSTSDKNHVIEALRKGVFFDNEEYRHQFALLIHNGLVPGLK